MFSTHFRNIECTKKETQDGLSEGQMDTILSMRAEMLKPSTLFFCGFAAGRGADVACVVQDITLFGLFALVFGKQLKSASLPPSVWACDRMICNVVMRLSKTVFIAACP